MKNYYQIKRKEIDLNQFKQKLEKLKEELNQPKNISIE